jgi:hypothetical protein
MNERVGNERQAQFSLPLPISHPELACEFVAFSSILATLHTEPTAESAETYLYLDTHFCGTRYTLFVTCLATWRASAIGTVCPRSIIGRWPREAPHDEVRTDHPVPTGM